MVINNERRSNTTTSTTKKIGKTVKGFSDFEKAAMKERAEELRVDKAGGEKALLAKIAQMPEPDRTMAERIHTVIKANALLSPKTWYGMPAYANKDGKVVCFFQSASKFKSRYATLGFTDTANLDDGAMWPTSFAIAKLTATEETKIVALMKKAVNRQK